MIVSNTLYRSKYWHDLEAYLSSSKDLAIIIVTDTGSEYKPSSANLFTVDSKSVSMTQLLAQKNVTVCWTLAEPAAIMESLYYGVPVLLFAETDEQRAMAKRVERAGVGSFINNITELDKVSVLEDDSN